MILNILLCDHSYRDVLQLAECIGGWDEINIIDYSRFDHDNISKDDRCCYCIASYEPSVRKTVYEAIKGKCNIATLIHPDNFISKYSIVEEGCIIFKGVIIYADSVICSNTVMREYSSLSHDSKIGSGSVIMEKCTIGGFSTIGKEVQLLEGTVVKDKLTLGDGVITDVGSVVLKDLEDGCFVKGNPARVVK